MNKLLASIGGRKWIATLIGMGLISAMVFTGQDLETIKWFGLFVSSVVIGYNIGQGFADGVSNGRTSSKDR